MKCICPILEEPTQVIETPYSQDPWLVVKCVKTGLVFLANPPDTSQLESDYGWEKTAAAETKRRKQEEPVITRISAFVKAVKRLLFSKRNIICSLTENFVQNKEKDRPLQFLDVGCGWGHLLEEIHRRFARMGRTMVPNGIEISRELAEYSRKKISPLGGKLVFANALEGSDQFAEGSIDVIILSSFLEHESQPLALMKKLHPILAPDGVVILKVPNYDSWNRILRGRKWCGFRFPDHVNYFTPDTLQKLAQAAHFTIARQNLLDRSPLSDSMYAILKKSA